MLVKDKDYISDVVIVKLKPQHRDFFQSKNSALDKMFQKSSLVVEQMFPDIEKPAVAKNSYGQTLVDLSVIYTLKFDPSEQLERIINVLTASGFFEYVEPYFIPELLYTPNDPLISNQYHLTKIDAFSAWNISKGDTNIVIGIIDSGTDLLHADLINNIKLNYHDPIDGIDNDNDGFTDNFHGWDIGENDNNPQYNIEPHGVHMSGIASAETDNGTGIAGTGFYCRFLPVKATDENGYLTKAYQGVIYAAEKNCKVINCSWGSMGGDGQFGQDIVNYVTYNKGAVVVAAAGNSHNELLYYPASYENVISVAASDANDLKWTDLVNGTGSNYNYHVDICAPGHQIYSTWTGGSYLSSNGSSMSAAVVSACAAIVAAHNPNFTPNQIIQQLKVTADVIDTITANTPFMNKLGSGRVNLYKALAQTNIPSINMIALNQSDEELASYSNGDTVIISGTFINYLAPVTSLGCTLTSLSPHVSVVDNQITFPSGLGTLDTVNNASFPFNIVINPSMPANTKVFFKLTFNGDNNYTEKQYFSIIFNTDYFTIDTNRIAITFTSRSRFGYNDNLKEQGIGMIYDNATTSQLALGGLIVAASPVLVSDNIYGSTVGSYNNHFLSVEKAHRILPSVFSDYDARAIFNDSLAGINSMGLEIINNIYAWNKPADEKFIISEYLIINKSNTDYSNLYAGLFMDWEIEEEKYHITDFDINNKIGYSYDSHTGSNYTAIKLLSTGNYRFYAFDNNNGIKISDGFTNYEKYNALRTNKYQAGILDKNNEIMNLFSCGPYSPNPGDTIKFAFAIIAGDYLNDIFQSAAQSQYRYDNLCAQLNTTATNNSQINIFPNPCKQEVHIWIENLQKGQCLINITDNTGRTIKSIQTDNNSQPTLQISIPVNEIKQGLYFISVRTAQSITTKPFVIF